jgi:hypothetical protein
LFLAFGRKEITLKRFYEEPENYSEFSTYSSCADYSDLYYRAYICIEKDAS